MKESSKYLISEYSPTAIYLYQSVSNGQTAAAWLDKTKDWCLQQQQVGEEVKLVQQTAATAAGEFEGKQQQV